jgi:O-antigen/teichoic acid export membrane protein
MSGTLLAITPMTVTVIVLAKPVLRIWAGREYAEQSYLPCLILLAGVWFQAMGYVAYNLLIAGARSSAVAKLRWIEIVPFVLFAAFMVTKYGAIGAAIAWSVRVVIDVVILLVAANKLRDVPVFAATFRSVSCVAFLMAAAGAAMFFRDSAPRYAFAGVALIAYATLTWYRGITKDDRTAFAWMLRGAR